MSLEYAILGFLQHTSLSGYDMKKMIDLSINHFWSADQSQIYRTLSRLTSDKMVEAEVIQQDNRPNSKVYHITEKGKEEFYQWLTSPSPLVEPRVTWLIKLFFAGEMPDHIIINNLEQLAKQIRIRIQTYHTLVNAGPNHLFQTTTSREAFFRELTIDYGITIHQSLLDWLEKSIQCIKQKDQSAIFQFQ